MTRWSPTHGCSPVGSWSQLDIEGPPERLSPALGYDARREVWVMYGGFGADGSELGDTWEFDGSTWECSQECLDG